MPDLLDLEGRVAIVTGGTRGIGRAIAELLAAHGATLILNARSDGDAERAFVEELRGKHGRPAVLEPGDIADPQTSAAAVKRAFSEHKRLDVFVNNAGVLLDGLIGMVSQDDMRRTMDTNLIGVLHGIQAAARLMVRGGGGSIINLTSIIGRVGNEGQLVYGASKAGVIGATLSAAKELAPRNVRVNAIAPGFIDTDMTRRLPLDKREKRLSAIAMGRIGTPEDVAQAALFFASDMSSYVTGQVLGVDGGMLV